MNRINTQRDIVKLMKLIVNNKLNPYSLSKQEQTLIIEYLRYEEIFTIANIASLLNLHRDTVRSRLKRVDEAIRTRLIATGFDPWSVISELMRIKGIVQTKAALKGDWGLVWKTEIDTIEKIIKLGLIKEVDPDEDELRGPEQKFDKKKLIHLLQETREKESKVC